MSLHIITIATRADEKRLSALFAEVINGIDTITTSEKAMAIRLFGGDSLHQKIENRAEHAMVIAQTTHDIVGFAFGKLAARQTFWIQWIGMHDDWRGKKINGGDASFADVMVTYLTGRAQVSGNKTMESIIEPGNVHAIDAFTRWGFTDSGGEKQPNGKVYRRYVRKLAAPASALQ